VQKVHGDTVDELDALGAAETIVEKCANTLIVRCSASERDGASEFASKPIGEREVVHTTRSSTGEPDRWFSSTTRGHLPGVRWPVRILKIEPAAMAMQIERLPDLEEFLKRSPTGNPRINHHLNRALRPHLTLQHVRFEAHIAFTVERAEPRCRRTPRITRRVVPQGRRQATVEP
jgi:hypothetical protein